MAEGVAATGGVLDGDVTVGDAVGTADGAAGTTLGAGWGDAVWALGAAEAEMPGSGWGEMA